MEQGTPADSKLRSRPAVQLRPATEKKLAGYSALASAATGLGVLALAQPSHAEVIYKPTHQVIAHHSTLGLDLNGDGIIDFVFSNVSAHHATGNSAGLNLRAAAAGNVPFCNSSFPEALRAGTLVGASAHFCPIGQQLLGKAYQNLSGLGYVGSWAPLGGYIKNQYLGVRFVIDGETHYGWARMSVSVKPTGVTAVLTGYAYESKANTPIITGPPSGGKEVSPDSVTLGDLAIGAASKR
jgi:hypothetical protein